MLESKILKNFFEEHHRHFKKKAYTTLQCLCGKHPLHSEHGEWLKRQGDQKPAAPENPDFQKYNPRD
jgi:hypothetical protein